MSQQIDNDLSPYERLRLDNIRRNAAFLASLDLPSTQITAKSASLDVTSKIKSESKNRKRVRPAAPLVVGTRSSKRLLQLKEDSPIPIDVSPSNTDKLEEDQDQEEDTRINYEEMPISSEELDDFEFEAYTHLRAWRLKRCKELDIEPYKICQNRTLAEFIRLRRNNSAWATGYAQPRSLSDHKNTKDIARDESEQEYDANIKEADLLQCWGIGPSKAKEGGFGYEMIDLIDQNPVAELFEKSRKLSSIVSVSTES